MAGRGRQTNIIVPSSKKTLVICGLATIIFMYLIYSWMSGPSEHGHVHLKAFSTWKTLEFVDIPAEVTLKAKDQVKIEERTLTFNFNGKPMTLYTKEFRPTTTNAIDILLLHGAKFSSQTWFDAIEVGFFEVNADSKEAPVLLLHGAGSSSDIWVKLGTLKLLGAMGNRAIALDLPGHAKSKKESAIAKEGRPEFLAQFIKQENLNRPVIVAPSMSGSYAIPFLMQPKPATCDERGRAFIALAPVQTEDYTHAEYHRCEIPVMINYGSKDVTLGLTSVGNLRNMPNSEIFVTDGAGHANYEERPEEWHKLLYNFMLAVKREQSRA